MSRVDRLSCSFSAHTWKHIAVIPAKGKETLPAFNGFPSKETNVLRSAPRTALARQPQGSSYRHVSSKITTDQSSPPSSPFRMQRQGNLGKLVHGNFFSVMPAISTPDKPQDKFCLSNRRSAGSEFLTRQPLQLPAYTQRTHDLSSSSQLFPL